MVCIRRSVNFTSFVQLFHPSYDIVGSLSSLSVLRLLIRTQNPVESKWIALADQHAKLRHGNFAVLQNENVPSIRKSVRLHIRHTGPVHCCQALQKALRLLSKALVILGSRSPRKCIQDRYSAGGVDVLGKSQVIKKNTGARRSNGRTGAYHSKSECLDAPIRPWTVPFAG